MSVFFNAVVIKLILVVFTTILFVNPVSIFTQRRWKLPIIRITTSAEKDTVTTEKSAEDKEKEKKKEKPVKISISDKGIMVGAEGDEKVILELDTEKLLQQVQRLEELPESLLAILDDEEGRLYFKDRGKDLIKVGESIHIERFERVRGDVVSVFDDVTVEGKVLGSVVAVFGDIELSPTAVVNGDVVCVLGTLEADDDAMIRGETMSIGAESPSFRWMFPAFGRGAFRMGSRIVIFLVGVLLLGIIIAFLPDRMKRSSEYVFGSFFKSLGVGVLVFLAGAIVVAIIAAILSITIIGIPVAILLVLSFAALLVIGYFVSALALGSVIRQKINIESDSLFVQGLIGLFLLALLGLISGLMYFNPFLGPARIFLRSLGGFINLLALLTGVGAFVLAKAGSKPVEVKPVLPE